MPENGKLFVALDQSLLADLLPTLGSISLENYITELIQKDLHSKQDIEDISPCFPLVPEELPAKAQYADLSAIDRQEVIQFLKTKAKYTNEELFDLPSELHSLLEYDLADSTWIPRDDWEDLLHDYLDQGSHTTLDCWIQTRRQEALDDEAQMWVELSKMDLPQ